jgi:predicted dinucleotide-binding enzyme
MKIGILGAGYIGKTLARKLAAAGHDVKVANSRGADTIPADVLETGARAVASEDAVIDVDVVIISVRPTSFDKIKALVAALPETTVVIDTSNYYPGRDGNIPAIDAGQVEGEWVAEQLGRRIVKAWNAIGADSLANKGKPKGDAGRIAIPVAGDRQEDRNVAIALVEDTGFDGFDAGILAESWRQQPGSPCYCTDLIYQEMGPALASTERHRIAKRRDIAALAIAERTGHETINPGADYLVRLNRALFC